MPRTDGNAVQVVKVQSCGGARPSERRYLLQLLQVRFWSACRAVVSDEGAGISRRRNDSAYIVRRLLRRVLASASREALAHPAPYLEMPKKISKIS